MTTPERRAELLESVARHERELDRAVADLKDAVRRPVLARLRRQIANHPTPWIVGALLLGFRLGGSGNRRWEEP